MKHIPKNHQREPQSLRIYRETTPGASYNGLPGDVKQAVRTVLATEQGLLCAYCNGRIHANSSGMEIEHYIPQNRHPESRNLEAEHRDNQLRYQNMLGTCQGNRSCSGIRQNKPLSIDPRNPACERLIKFLKNGKAHSDDPLVEQDIRHLRLNDISENRRQVIDKVRENLIRLSPVRSWDNSLIDREIEKWSTLKNTRHGRAFEPYCMAAVQYLESKKI